MNPFFMCEVRTWMWVFPTKSGHECELCLRRADQFLVCSWFNICELRTEMYTDVSNVQNKNGHLCNVVKFSWWLGTYVFSYSSFSHMFTWYSFNHKVVVKALFSSELYFVTYTKYQFFITNWNDRFLGEKKLIIIKWICNILQEGLVNL